MKVEFVKTGYLEENCYVLSINNECLIVDPGDEFDKIKSLVGTRKVLAILVTHYHFDHVGALFDAKKYYNVNVIDYKSNKLNNIGPFNFEIIDTKGHKDDLVSFYFRKYNIMFVGDFIFKGSVGRCDLPGGNIFDMKKSIEKIKKFDKNIILYPGHGDKTTLEYEIKTNPFLKEDTYE